ncbi:MAG TPA: S41 family peptidase [Phycisphaerae bacterium]|jgi:carboxyl-terminal processing protease
MTTNSLLRAATLSVVCLAVGYAMGRRNPYPQVAVPQAHLAAPVRDSYQFFDTLVDLRSQILHNYVEKVDDDKLMNGAIKGMMAELDPYSNYFTKDELAAFDRAVHGQFSGIGAEISQDPSNGNFVIVSPLEESPALKAGVYAGDHIVKIAGDSTDGLSLKELLTKVSGEPGSILKMTVIHEGDKNPIDLAINRQVIQVHSVRGVKHDPAGNWDFLIDPEHRIGYVRITNFMENTADELDKALLPLINDKKNASLKGIIIDLRFDPGGLLQAGIDVCKRFLDSGVIVTAGRPDSSKRDFVSEATSEKTYPRIPLVVLINEYSASASEIVAGALKDHHRAVLIGARSFGKGSVQTLINLDNGNAALKLTTQYYYLPSGNNIMRKKDAKEWGVEPDPAFNIPLTDDENRAVLIARNQSEIIHKTIGATPAAATAPALADSASPGTLDKTAGATTKGAEPADRQLQRAMEILIAYQAFGTGRDFAADVTTTRPGVSASVPATRPDSTPQAPPPDVPR